MRTFTRKLLSLLLAFTMVCAMVPAAMAADEDSAWSDWSTAESTSENKQHTEGTTSTTKTATCTAKGEETQYCGNTRCTATRTRELPMTEHKFDKSEGNESGHWKVCSVCGTKEDNSSSTAHDYEWKEDGTTHKQVCKTCGYVNASHTASMDWNGVKGSNGSHGTKCSVAGCTITGTQKCEAITWTERDQSGHTGVCRCGAEVSEKHDYDTSGVCKDCKYTNQNPVDEIRISYSGGSAMNVGDTRTLTVTATDASGAPTNPGTVTWDSSNSIDISGNGTKVEIEAEYSDSSAWVSAMAGSAKYDTVRFTIEATDDLEVTIYEGMGTYYFSDEDADGVSLEDLLYDALDDTRYDYDEDDLIFSISDKTSTVGTISYDKDENDVYYFGDVEFEIKKTGTFTASYYVEEYHGDTILSGKIIINVEEGGSVGDIIYTAKNGEDVEFDVDDFEDFWDDNSSKGSLEYVTFDSVPSGKGSLVDGEGEKVSTKADYYVDPGKRDADLDGITFEPKSNLKTAVTIGFTAYGTNKKSVSGTVVILYTEKEPEAIVYNSTGKNITLDADDFLDNYKDTVGSSASNIQIQFLDAPSNGTLYYNYNEKTEKGTELTSKNVQNYTFSTNTRASRSIEDVTYVPDSRGRADTIKFAAYTSSGELRYYGEVTFGQTVRNVSVSMTSTSAGVTFQTSSFTGADSAMLTVSSISFGTPSSGTLYKNWTGTSGTRVTASDMFSYVASVTGNPSLSTVTYVPVAGYSGNVTIPFSAYSTTGNSIINGTVTIRVTATTTTTVFTDVPTTGSQAWAAPYISRLYSAGVVGGVTATTYGPKQAVKWGEALKMVLRGAGYPAQTEGTGSNWAANYLTYAYNNGLVSSNSIDLNSNITRLEMAELAAKALKMSPASRINSGIVGPTDTTNGYVYALYNAGIVGGDSSSGQNRYNGGSSLNRDEMAKIVCGVMDYNG